MSTKIIIYLVLLANFVLLTSSQTSLCIFILTILLGATATPDWTDCPSPCRCKWASGKKTAICSSGAFTKIPDLNSEMQVLDLQGNFISFLESDAFSSVNLLNLQKIFMRNSSLNKIDRDTFRGLTIMVELDLSYNQISSIPRGSFYGNNRLKILTLSGNPLKTLEYEQFPPLPHLRILDLENCQLLHIHDSSFIHLENLENLNLKYNSFSILTKNPFKPLKSLKSLELFGNPWNCDCNLRDFRNWYLSSNLRTSSITCNEPFGHRGKKWGDISSLGFACSPRVELSKTIVETKLGRNATFACYVKGDPDPEVKWLFETFTFDGDNSTGNNNHTYFIDVEKHQSGVWVNLTVINVTDSDAGTYTCQARSYVEITTKNVSLVIQDSRFKSLIEVNYLLVFIGLLGVGLTILVIVFTAIACSCLKQKSQGMKRKNNKNNSKNVFEQDKHLLDISSSLIDQSMKSSCELINSCTNEDLVHSSSLMLDRCEAAHYIHKIPRNDYGKIMQVSPPVFNTFGVYPPPPEFSTGKSSAMGNIFISVALNQEVTSNDSYPDLLDIQHKSGFNNNCNTDRNIVNESCGYFSSGKTNSRYNVSNTLGTHYENTTGIFAASLRDAADNENSTSECFGHDVKCMTLRRPNFKQTINEANCMMSNDGDATVVPYATLPKKPLRVAETSITEPVYDNMGKRVTIGGSSTLSLPEDYDSIPTPPPPPLAKRPNIEDFVCL